MGQLVDDLRAAKALIDTPEKWGKGARGIIAPRRCIIHAVSDVIDCFGFGSDQRIREKEAFDALAAVRRIGSISIWNDAPERTHEDVMAVFDQAIAAAEASAK